MEQLFEQFSRENVWWAYAALFASAFVENVFPPIPGDTVTLIGAYFVGRGHLNYWGVLISTTLGSVAGFMALFMIAYWLEWKFFEQRQFKWLHKSRLEKVERWFRKYGYGIILANRFLSGIRSVISISAGLTKLNITKVALLSTASAVVWNGVIIYAGAFIGKSKDEIFQYIKMYNQAIIAGLAVLATGYLVYYFFFKIKKAA